MQQGPGGGMLIGQKGVKYGLIVPGRGGSKPAAQAPPGVKKPGSGGAPRKLAAFGADSESEEEDVGTQVARQAAKKRSDTKVQDMYAAALAEDPTAFDYDGVYEEMQAEKAVPRQQERLDRRPKYIATLLEQAQLRKRDEDITFERRQLKERSKEDHLYDDSERFVTAAYRRKLEEDKKWQEEQKQREAEEAANDVTKLGHMGNFYKNLMKKNVAFGAAPSAAVAGASPKAAREPAASASPSAAAEATEAAAGAPAASQLAAAAAAAGVSRRQADEEALPGSRGGAAHGVPVSPSGAAAGSRKDRDSLAPSTADTEDERTQEAVPSSTTPAAPLGGQQAAGAAAGDDAAEGAEVEGAEAAAPAVVGGKRRNDEDAVAAARARYLARKQRVK